MGDTQAAQLDWDLPYLFSAVLMNLMNQRLEGLEMIGKISGASYETQRSGDVRIEASAAAVIGETVGAQLRGVYQDVTNHPEPDTFLALLRRLDEA